MSVPCIQHITSGYSLRQWNIRKLASLLDSLGIGSVGHDLFLVPHSFNHCRTVHRHCSPLRYHAVVTNMSGLMGVAVTWIFALAMTLGSYWPIKPDNYGGYAGMN
ncbi:hypothetical protein ScPMuIL_012024 [Solemya velum]